MKFIERGAVRVGSQGSTPSFAHVAFRNPDGKVVLVAVNAGSRERSFHLICAGRVAAARLAGKSVATFVWQK